MRPTRNVRIVTALAVLCIAASAHARPKRDDTKNSSAPVAETPAAGGCTYRAGDDDEPTTIKDCGVVGNGGEFEVRAAKGQAVVVRLDEQIRTVIPNRDPNVAIESSSSFAVYELIGEIKDGWTTTIQTERYTVTLRFVTVKRRGDSQIHIVRADRADRDAEVERRVAAEKERLQTEYEQRYAELDDKAAKLARRHIVKHLQLEYSTADPGVRPTRNDFVVLRAERVIRLGRTRYLQITVENRDRPTFHIGAISGWIEAKAGRERTGVTWTCGTNALRGRKKTKCTLGLRLEHQLASSDRIRIRVRSRDKKRSVTLGGIDVR